jgi:hypothetical protein
MKFLIIVFHFSSQRASSQKVPYVSAIRNGGNTELKPWAKSDMVTCEFINIYDLLSYQALVKFRLEKA